MMASEREIKAASEALNEYAARKRADKGLYNDYVAMKYALEAAEKVREEK